jgi:hypothetical protein
VGYLSGDTPETFLLLVPKLDGAITALRGAPSGTSDRGDVQSLVFHAVAPGTWISLSLVVPAIGFDEAEVVWGFNLAGGSTTQIDFHAAVVRVDGTDVGAREAAHDGQRLTIFEGDDYTAAMFVRGTTPEPVELSTAAGAHSWPLVDNDWFGRACQLFDSSA